MKAVEEKIPKRYNLLDLFNSSSDKELRNCIKNAGVKEGNINKIIPQIFENQPFTSLEEIPKYIKGLSEKAMLKLIENWINNVHT
jgi:hypothetical protein